MKKTLLALTLGLLLSAGTASAQPFGEFSLWNPTTASFVSGIFNLDWSSSGSGTATGLGGAGESIPDNQEFTFRYQASLAAISDINGNSIAMTGLGTDFEYTIVAQLPEITGTTTFTALADPLLPLGTIPFTTLEGGQWAIWFSDPENSNVLAGTGFDDGTKVAEGTINAGETTVFTFNPNNLTGIGSAILNGLVDMTDPTLLFGDFGLQIFDIRFEGTVNQPALDSTTDSFFDGNKFAVYQVQTGDQLFKVDGSNKFSVVPEPSTFLLLGAGLIGLAGIARRKK